MFPFERFSAATTATDSCSPIQCLVPVSPPEMLSTVAPSSLIRTPTLKKNIQTTSSLASWLSNALDPSIEISGSAPPPSEHASSLAMIQEHSQGIPDGLPGPLPPLPLTLGLQRQKSNALQVNPEINGVVPRHSDSNSSSHCASTTAVTNLHEKARSMNYIQVTPNWDCLTTSNIHYHVGIQHINRTSAHLKSMQNRLVSWECPDGPCGSPVDPENPGYRIQTISIVFLKTLFVCHRVGAYL